jgi:hypothetical protein
VQQESLCQARVYGNKENNLAEERTSGNQEDQKLITIPAEIFGLN